MRLIYIPVTILNGFSKSKNQNKTKTNKLFFFYLKYRIKIKLIYDDHDDINSNDGGQFRNCTLNNTA